MTFLKVERNTNLLELVHSNLLELGEKIDIL
jgi:hypothetical protein